MFRLLSVLKNILDAKNASRLTVGSVQFIVRIELANHGSAMICVRRFTGRFLVSVLFVTTTLFMHHAARAGAPINFTGYATASSSIFSKAGPTQINYQLYDEYLGIFKPGKGIMSAYTIRIVVSSQDQVLDSCDVTSTTGGLGYAMGVPHLLSTGSFVFNNPTDQPIYIAEFIFWQIPLSDLPGFEAEEWTAAPGKSLVSGGDTSPVGTPPPPTTRGNNIHAVIISGLRDPAKIVTSANVTLTGGVVALGKDPSPPVAPTTSWSSGLHIVPDRALLTGAKFPPLTPNIIDVRIVKHEVVGDLAVPSVSPSP